MLYFTLLVIAGALIGLYVQVISREKAYGAVADALLGITGAFAAAWAIGPREITWSARASLTIWTAAFLPYLSHFLARRRMSAAGRQVRRRGR
jgi:uncharacterized membrane protein YeaQ/YmgE (transglycosylase-associated protein family)